jgi:putative DNA primase/helicase
MGGTTKYDFSSVRSTKLVPLNLTDAGNAEAFAILHGERFRFDHSRGKWLVWNGRYWMADETGEADRAALDTARQRLMAAMLITDTDDRQDAAQWSLHSESTYARRAMLTSAQSIASLATTAADYDRDPLLFTVGNGTLDLRTGELRECRPDNLITRATEVDYLAVAQCPRWMRFLEEVFLGDQELITFVQRAVGYSLSGDTREQCLLILYGGGANGKSTFLEIMLKLVGTHGAITSFSTFLVHQNPGTPRNDVAKLRGARLVKAAESQKQAALDEATVKEVTGGDTISARFLFREFFDFRPQFKIWLTTNHRPTIYGTDDAIWRRIRLIPFNQQFTGKRRDSRLREKLEAELSGVLAWAVRGCLEWQRIGLGDAPAVESATLQYRRESDHFGRFLSERCTDRPRDQASGRELFDAYVQWCANSGEKPESNNTFAKALADRAMQKKRTKKGTVYTGVGLRPSTKAAKPIKDDSS